MNPYFSEVLSARMESEPMRSLACFLALFVSMYMLAVVCGVITTYLMRLRRSGWLSRTVGVPALHAGLRYVTSPAQAGRHIGVAFVLATSPRWEHTHPAQ